jgi:hypothetical protein
MLQQALSQSVGYRWQFSRSQLLDEACATFLANIWRRLVRRYGCPLERNPLGMLWPVMSADGGGLTATARRPTIIIAAWLKREQKPRWGSACSTWAPIAASRGSCALGTILASGTPRGRRPCGRQ